jgi:transcriptional regulator with XRE-family HTH domain
MTNLRALLSYNIRERRKNLNISQEQLAEKVSTSTHYIGQIERKNKFPSPEMLERLAAALEIDSPQLFSMTSFTEEALKNFHTNVLSDMEAAMNEALSQSLAQTIAAHSSDLKLT